MNTDIEDEISESFLEEEAFKTGIQKIGEILSGEIKLIRTILISCLTVIIICILLYFNYILIGQFFTTIFLSFIVSLALKPTKEKIINRITNHFQKEKYFLIKCTAFRIIQKIAIAIRYVIDQIIWLFRKIRTSETKIKIKENSTSKNHTLRKSQLFTQTHEVDTINANLTIFNNKNYLYLLCLIYVVVFKLEFYLSLTLVFSYLFIDFVIRLLIDIVFFAVKKTNKNSFFKYFIFQQKTNYELNDWMHSMISFIIILFFSVIILLIMGGSVWLFYIDTKSVVNYVRNNSDYMNYFKTILPDNFKEYYDGENLNYFHNSKVYVHLKSFEVFVNSALEEQLGNNTESIRGNYTLYDISNNLVKFIKDPLDIVNSHNKHGFNLDSYVKNNQKLQLIDFNFEPCQKYDKEIVYTIISYTEIEYLKRLYCGTRIFVDRYNLQFSLSIFSKYLKRGYKFFIKTFQLIAETFFLNALNFSLELINSIMLIILFYSCLFNFLKVKDDFIMDLLKFLPYPKKQIDKIHRSFHNSIQGVFVSTLEIFLYHTLLTWLIFDFCNIRFVFIFSIISGIITLLPVITPWMILIPGNFLNFIDNEFNLIKIILFNLSYYLLINFVDADIYKKNVKKSDPYFTGLSFVMGMYTFGLKGFIYGPVLLCVSITVIDIIKILIKFK